MSFNNKLNHLVPGNTILIGRDEMVVTTRHSNRWGIVYGLLDCTTAEQGTLQSVFSGTDHYFDILEGFADLYDGDWQRLQSDHPNVFQYFDGVCTDPRHGFLQADSIMEDMEVVR